MPDINAIHAVASQAIAAQATAPAVPAPPAALAVTQDMIDALLDASVKDGNASVSALMDRFHERARKRNHAAAKADQPVLNLTGGADHWADLCVEARMPYTIDEQAAGGIDYLCQTVDDCIAAGDLDDTLFALLRVWRWVRAKHRHLPPIETIGAPNAK
jgi:hypothetical protein